MAPKEQIQSISFSRKGWTKPSAEDWLAKHNDHPIKNVHVTANMLHYRLHDPLKFARFYTLKIKPKGRKRDAAIVMTVGLLRPDHESAVPLGPKRREHTVGGHIRDDLLEGRQADDTDLGPDPNDVEGDGLRDVFDRVKAAFGGPRTNAPPAVRSFLEKFGRAQIAAGSICRKPIASVIDKALNFLSLGRWAQKKKEYGYDQLFHLYLLLDLVLDGRHYSIIMEKNHVVNIQPSTELPGKAPVDNKGAGCINLPRNGALHGSGPLTLAEFMANGENYQNAGGKPVFWLYDPINNNCQVFILSLMLGNSKYGMYSPQAREFVLQPADKLLTGIAAKLARGVTGIASVGDILVNGRALPGNGTVGGHLGGGKVDPDWSNQMNYMHDGTLAGGMCGPTDTAYPDDYYTKFFREGQGSVIGYQPVDSNTSGQNYKPADRAAEQKRDMDIADKLQADGYTRNTMIGAMLWPKSLGGPGVPFPDGPSIYTPAVMR